MSESLDEAIESGHLSNESNDKQLKINLNSQFQSTLAQMKRDTDSVISALKKACNEAIHKHKEANKGLKTTFKYKNFEFNKERIDFLAKEMNSIGESYEISTPYQKKKLIETLEAKKQESNDLDRKINEQQSEIENLENQIKEKDKILSENENNLKNIDYVRKLLSSLEEQKEEENKISGLNKE